MTLQSKPLALIVMITFIAGIGISMAFNVWITETTKLPATYTDGDFAGQSNPADIRGSYALSDIASAFPVTVEVLAQAFGVPQDGSAQEFMVKELEELYGEREGLEIGTDSVRYFVALYCGLPFVPKEGTGLLPQALEILKAKLSGADFQALEKFLALAEQNLGATGESASVGSEQNASTVGATVGSEQSPAKQEPVAVETAKVVPSTSPEKPVTEKVATGTGQGTGTGKGTESASATGTTSTSKLIKGSTTFGELLAWGLTKSEISAILGSMGNDDVVIRTWLSEQGLEFSTYKTKLQEKLDALP